MNFDDEWMADVESIATTAQRQYADGRTSLAFANLVLLMQEMNLRCRRLELKVDQNYRQIMPLA